VTSWSLATISLVWLAWFALIVGVLAFNVRRQWQASVRGKTPASPAEALGFDTAGAASNTARPPAVKYLPEQHTDFVYSVVLDRVTILKFAVLFIGPPGLLTAAWLYGRRNRHPGRPT
jgi:hypothetical protein